jgi:hypothetical protein
MGAVKYMTGIGLVSPMSEVRAAQDRACGSAGGLLMHEHSGGQA